MESENSRARNYLRGQRADALLMEERRGEKATDLRPFLCVRTRLTKTRASFAPSSLHTVLAPCLQTSRGNRVKQMLARVDRVSIQAVRGAQGAQELGAFSSDCFQLCQIETSLRGLSVRSFYFHIIGEPDGGSTGLVRWLHGSFRNLEPSFYSTLVHGCHLYGCKMRAPFRALHLSSRWEGRKQKGKR